MRRVQARCNGFTPLQQLQKLTGEVIFKQEFIISFWYLRGLYGVQRTRSSTLLSYAGVRIMVSASRAQFHDSCRSSTTGAYIVQLCAGITRRLRSVMSCPAVSSRLLEQLQKSERA